MRPRFRVASALLFFSALLSCSPKLNTDKEKISYVIGKQLADNIKKNGIEVDPDVLARSIKDNLGSGKSAMSEVELQAALLIMQKKEQAKEDAAAQQKMQEADSFLKQNAQQPGVKSFSNGLQLLVIKEGGGKQPKKEDDSLLVKYKASLLSGQVFDSTDQLGRPLELKLGQAMPGLKMGLAQMKEGSVYRLFIPPALAYGKSGRPGIPPQSLLVYEVELVKVKPAMARSDK